MTFITDSDAMREVGARLREYRLQQNLTAQEIATKAGLQVRTVLNAELGANPRLATLVAILRALDRLDHLDAFLPPAGLSPMALLKRKGKPRQRARKPRDG